MPETVRSLGAVRVVPIDSIHASEGNPRVIPAKAVEMVAKSLAEFGWKQALVVDADGAIVAGHTRHLAAKSLGLKTVPVIVADDLTPEQVRAYRIADNRTGDFTSWDMTALVAELDELPEFAEVLGLADWEAIVAEAQAGDDALDMELDLSDDAAAEFTGYQITVTCATESARDLVEAAVAEMDGVMDVARKRS